MKHVMTTAEYCAYMKIGRSLVYKLINSGNLNHFRVGKLYRILVEMG